MTRLRASDGFTLVELLLASTLMLLVMGAALTTLDRDVRGNRRNQMLTQDTDAARTAIDLMARDARNATAYQTAANTSAGSVLRADPQDFVFKAIDASAAAVAGNPYRVQTVRYCYSAARRRLLRQVTPGIVSPATDCPDPSFTTTATVADVANGTRPLFGYDSPALAGITWASLDLYVDSTPTTVPAETAAHSGVFMRNANRVPTASFTATAGPNNHVQLNGSASIDPDGGVLTFSWKDGTTDIRQTSPVVDYVAPASGARTFTLTVTDQGALSATTQQTVTVQP